MAPPTFLIAFVLLAILSYVIGGLIVGIMTLRARVLPSVIGWITIAGGVAVLLSVVLTPPETVLNQIAKAVATTILFVGWAWAGARTMGRDALAPAH